jgi:hypothetical protein
MGQIIFIERFSRSASHRVRSYPQALRCYYGLVGVGDGSVVGVGDVSVVGAGEGSVVAVGDGSVVAVGDGVVVGVGQSIIPGGIMPDSRKFRFPPSVHIS